MKTWIKLLIDTLLKNYELINDSNKPRIQNLINKYNDNKNTINTINITLCKIKIKQKYCKSTFNLFLRD